MANSIALKTAFYNKLSEYESIVNKIIKTPEGDSDTTSKDRQKYDCGK